MSTTFEMLVTVSVPTINGDDYEKIVVQTDATGNSQAEAIADAVDQVEAFGLAGYLEGVSLKTPNLVRLHHDETFEDTGLPGLVTMMKARGVKLDASVYRAPSEASEDLTGVSDAAIMKAMVDRNLKIWLGTYSHRHGEDTSLFATEADAEEAILRCALQSWEADRADKSLPDDPSGLSDDEIISGYFDDNEDESYSIGNDRILTFDDNLSPENVENFREPINIVTGYGDKNNQANTL